MTENISSILETICLCGEKLADHKIGDINNHYTYEGCAKSGCVKFTWTRQ